MVQLLCSYEYDCAYFADKQTFISALFSSIFKHLLYIIAPEDAPEIARLFKASLWGYSKAR